MANADAAPRAVAAAACWAASCAVSRVPRMARGERTDSAVLDCLSPRRSAIGGQTALSDRSRGASRQICGCHILFPLFRISRAVALASVIEQMSSWRSVAVAVVCVCRDTCVRWIYISLAQIHRAQKYRLPCPRCHTLAQKPFPLIWLYISWVFTLQIR